MHTFLDCPVTSSFYTDIWKWFNTVSNLNLIPLNEQILFHIKMKNVSYKKLQKELTHSLLLGTFQTLTIVLLVLPPPLPPYQCCTKFAITFNQASINTERGRGGLEGYNTVCWPFIVRYLQEIG